MKKTTFCLLVLILAFVSMGDECDDTPSRGFGIAAVYQDVGPLGIYEVPVPGSVTRGQLIQGADNYSGTVSGFQRVAGNSGQSYVEEGIAPGLWRMTAEANWLGCTGQSNLFDIDRGKYNYLLCLRIGRFGFPFLPSTLDASAPATEFIVYGEGITTNYGMPTLQFYNQFGTLAAQTTASQVASNGSWLKGWSNCLSNLPIGPYTVDVINATPDGAGALLSQAKMYLYGSWQQQPIDDPSFFVRQQYSDFLNRAPDQAGWQAWTNYIMQCNSDASCLNSRRITTSRGFMESAEFRQNKPALADPSAPGYMHEYVRQCYLTYLQREPGGGEDTGWINYISSTGDYDGLVGGFINSGEYRVRFLPPVEINSCNPSEVDVQMCENQGYGAYFDWDICGCSYPH